MNSEAHATDNGPLMVDEYQVNALDTGEQHTIHIAGDVVLAAPGIELEHLETPPSPARGRPATGVWVWVVRRRGVSLHGR